MPEDYQITELPSTIEDLAVKHWENVVFPAVQRETNFPHDLASDPYSMHNMYTSAIEKGELEPEEAEQWESTMDYFNAFANESIEAYNWLQEKGYSPDEINQGMAQWYEKYYPASQEQSFKKPILMRLQEALKRWGGGFPQEPLRGKAAREASQFGGMFGGKQ